MTGEEYTARKIALELGYKLLATEIEGC